MRRLLLVMAVVPFTVSAQGVARSQPAPEEILIPRHHNAALTTATFDGLVLPARGVTVSALTCRISAQSAGTGNTTVRVSDGTNNCDCVASCAGTGVSAFGDAGMKRVACSGGCTFAASAVLTMSVTAGCGTTQATPTSLQIRGYWR
jgi:hypothetical protein